MEGAYFTLISRGKGQSQHLLEVPWEAREKQRLRMGAEGPNKNKNEFTMLS